MPPGDAKVEELKEKARQYLIEPERRKRLKRYFDEKFLFLGECRRLEEPIPRVLSAVHRYRNEAYHSNKIRKETIRPVVLLLFELACELLVTLLPGVFSVDGSDDWSAFERRFGVHALDAPQEEGARRIRDVLRHGLSLEVVDLRELLADHLESRVEELFEALAFIKEKDFDQIKSWIVSHSEKFSEANKEYKSVVIAFKAEDFAHVRTEIEALRQIDDKVSLFSAFANAEAKFEPVEECVHELAREIDAAIQLQVDIERGK